MPFSHPLENMKKVELIKEFEVIINLRSITKIVLGKGLCNVVYIEK